MSIPSNEVTPQADITPTNVESSATAPQQKDVKLNRDGFLSIGEKVIGRVKNLKTGEYANYANKSPEEFKKITEFYKTTINANQESFKEGFKVVEIKVRENGKVDVKRIEHDTPATKTKFDAICSTIRKIINAFLQVIGANSTAKPQTSQATAQQATPESPAAPVAQRIRPPIPEGRAQPQTPATTQGTAPPRRNLPPLPQVGTRSAKGAFSPTAPALPPRSARRVAAIAAAADKAAVAKAVDTPLPDDDNDSPLSDQQFPPSSDTVTSPQTPIAVAQSHTDIDPITPSQAEEILKTKEPGENILMPDENKPGDLQLAVKTKNGTALHHLEATENGFIHDFTTTTTSKGEKEKHIRFVEDGHRQFKPNDVRVVPQELNPLRNGFQLAARAEAEADAASQKKTTITPQNSDALEKQTPIDELDDPPRTKSRYDKQLHVNLGSGRTADALTHKMQKKPTENQAKITTVDYRTDDGREALGEELSHLTHDSRLYLIGHCDRGSDTISSDGNTVQMKAQEFAQMIADNDVNDNLKKKSPDGKKLKISLVACYAGASGEDGQDSYALQLSKALADKDILAEVVARTDTVIRATNNQAKGKKKYKKIVGEDGRHQQPRDKISIVTTKGQPPMVTDVYELKATEIVTKPTKPVTPTPGPIPAPTAIASAPTPTSEPTPASPAA